MSEKLEGCWSILATGKVMGCMAYRFRRVTNKAQTPQSSLFLQQDLYYDGLQIYLRLFRTKKNGSVARFQS